MPTSQVAAAKEREGVVYRNDDCLGFPRRLLIEVIDIPVFVVLCVLVFLLAGIVPGLPQDDRAQSRLLLFATVASALSYFVLLKRSRFRTLGYVVAGARIVNLQGERPSLVSMFFRLLFGAVGPINYLVDLIWMTSDPQRQALRDKFAHTYVIRRNAVPSGRGPIVYSHYTILGATFLFQEVRPGPAPGLSPPSR